MESMRGNRKRVIELQKSQVPFILTPNEIGEDAVPQGEAYRQQVMHHIYKKNASTFKVETLACNISWK